MAYNPKAPITRAQAPTTFGISIIDICYNLKKSDGRNLMISRGYSAIKKRPWCSLPASSLRSSFMANGTPSMAEQKDCPVFQFLPTDWYRYLISHQHAHLPRAIIFTSAFNPTETHHSSYVEMITQLTQKPNPCILAI